MSNKTTAEKHQKSIYKIISVENAKQVSPEWNELLKTIPSNTRVNVGPVSPFQTRVRQENRKSHPDKFHPVVIYGSFDLFHCQTTNTERRILKALASGQWIESTDLKNSHQEIRKAVSNLRQAGVIILTGRAFHDEAVGGVSCWRMLGDVLLTPSAEQLSGVKDILQMLPKMSVCKAIEETKADEAYTKRLDNIEKMSSGVAI